MLQHMEDILACLLQTRCCTVTSNQSLDRKHVSSPTSQKQQHGPISDFGACSESLTVQLCENVASRTVCCQMPTGTVVVAHAYSTRTKFVLPHYLCLAAVGAGLPEGAAQTDRHLALEKRRMAAQPVHRLHSGC